MPLVKKFEKVPIQFCIVAPRGIKKIEIKRSKNSMLFSIAPQKHLLVANLSKLPKK
jgi:hypothetical protein